MNPSQRRNLPLLLLRASDLVLARFRPVLNNHGLTDQQWRIVRALWDTEPAEQHTLGAQCLISSPSLAGILARLEAGGMVQRERMESDQRRVIVHLTERSRALVAAMLPEIDQVYRELEETLGRGMIQECYGALDQVIDSLGAGSGGNPARQDENQD